MKRYVILLLFFSAGNTVFAQTTAANRIKAMELYESGNYAQAMPYLLTLLKSDSLDPELNYKTGVCYMHARSQSNKALSYFTIALNEKVATLSANDHELLGDCYLLAKQYPEARQVYERTRSMIDSASDEERLLNWKIAMCNRCVNAAPDKVALWNNELTLSYSATGIDSSPDYNDFYETVPSARIYPDTSVKPTYTEATIGTSPNSKNILLYRNEKGSAELCISTLAFNTWSVPHKLNRPVNDAGWEDGEYLSADGQTMYFVSDRKEGFGGKDIYKCERKNNGQWSKAINLGPGINSKYDEEAPFILPNGKVLYFSSGRNTNNNGSDVFYCRFENGSWSEPVQTGYPVKANSTIPVEYSASVETEPLITFFDNWNNKIIVITGSAAATKEKAPTELDICLKKAGADPTLSSYRTNTAFSFFLPDEERIKILYRSKNYLPHTEIIDLQDKQSFPAKQQRIFVPIRSGSVAELDNIRFIPGKTQPDQASEDELEYLAELLTTNDSITAELSGYNDSPADKRFNSKLSEGRVEAIISYLKKKGIGEERLIAKDRQHSIVEKKKEFAAENEPAVGQHIEIRLLTDKKKNISLTNNK